MSRSPFSQKRYAFFGLAVLAFGLLISARLLLVTGYPRRVNAEPTPLTPATPTTPTTPLGRNETPAPRPPQPQSQPDQR